VVHDLQVIGPELVAAQQQETVKLLQHLFGNPPVRRQDSQRDTALVINAVAVVIAEVIFVSAGIKLFSQLGRRDETDQLCHWYHLFELSRALRPIEH
jgi:hypothetical protein